MKIRRTAWYVMALAGVAGLIVGALFALFTQNLPVTLLGANWLVPALLILVGIVVGVFGWQVHRYVKGDLPSLDPQRAFMTLAFGKALEIVGPALMGWYVGQLLVITVHPDSPWAQHTMVECGVAALASLVDLIVGIVVEHWCELPPIDGPENPTVKANQKRPVADTMQKKEEQVKKKSCHFPSSRNN